MATTSNPRWYAAYTKPRNEKKVLERLRETGIEAYLPLQKRLKQWSDRKKFVEEPIFRSYIFVRIELKDYFNVLNTTGIVRFITFEGKAVPIPDKQIDQVKLLLEQKDVEVDVSEEPIMPGTMIEITSGVMIGLTGELVEHQGKQKVVVRLNHISHSLLVSLPAGYIAKAI
ncbi:MAG: UpxY family transcription antiterminator [Bacteroidales bacterium]|nr:UpxY family transcription antiterminator [Bacteroidales bacterium]MBN2750315.1 UpxY family transcription antiterminator [Bacteroidales bacterium]